VGWLHRRHVPRLVAVGVVFVGSIACLILLLVASSSE
jgi:predicted PurR-regulated permease PerM